ncbi:hypothetical protein GN244_ATG07591 [Phytophthora infestans]|uniref:Uncharacterized protein n=1 Tax=Phytophthora infestans TaxID=4787 RepID=A0A833WFL7_PHYIN|nr:hypothetical protein GN244_ATG07591 [Phytophthora infestans]
MTQTCTLSRCPRGVPEVHGVALSLGLTTSMRAVWNTAFLLSFAALWGCTTSSRGSFSLGSPMVAEGASLGEAGRVIAVSGEATVVTGPKWLLGGADGSEGFALF